MLASSAADGPTQSLFGPSTTGGAALIATFFNGEPPLAIDPGVEVPELRDMAEARGGRVGVVMPGGELIHAPGTAGELRVGCAGGLP